VVNNQDESLQGHATFVSLASGSHVFILHPTGHSRNRARTSLRFRGSRWWPLTWCRCRRPRAGSRWGSRSSLG